MQDIMNCSLQAFPYRNLSDVGCNTTDNETTPPITRHSAPNDFWNSQTFKLLTVVVYSIILFNGVVGNSLIISTVARWRSMRTPCNILISNISAADIMYLLLAASLRIIEVYQPWPFGEITCQLIAPLQDVFLCVSVVTHSIIAWERQRALVTPFKSKITFKLTIIFLAIAWVGCYLTVGLPVAVVLKFDTFYGFVQCHPTWSNLYRKIYVVFLTLFFIVVQVVVQLFAYVRIINVLYFQGDSIALTGDSHRNTSSQRYIRRSQSSDSHSSRISSCPAWRTRTKKKQMLVKMLLLQVLTFQASWIFRCGVMLVEEFWFNLSRYIGWISVLMCYIQQVINPIIVYSMSTDFRAGVKKNCERDCNVCKKRRSCKEETALERVVPLNTNPTPEEICIEQNVCSRKHNRFVSSTSC